MSEMDIFEMLDMRSVHADATREYRERMRLDGWEYCGERGGDLWEFNRGYRWSEWIVDVMIDPEGKGFWFKASGFRAAKEKTDE